MPSGPTTPLTTDHDSKEYRLPHPISNKPAIQCILPNQLWHPLANLQPKTKMLRKVGDTAHHIGKYWQAEEDKEDNYQTKEQETDTQSY